MSEPRKKVGIVACSGEELSEGTVSRLAALRVLHELRPRETVTICLPLFLAGGEGERAFARLHPTITVDGCEKRCAAIGTERYSARPAVSLVVSEIVAREGLAPPCGLRKLDPAGMHAAEVVADLVASKVDDLLGTRGEPAETAPAEGEPGCACRMALPTGVIRVHGFPVTLLGLPLIFGQFRDGGKPADPATAKELLETVAIYSPVPDSAREDYREALLEAYRRFLAGEEKG